MLEPSSGQVAWPLYRTDASSAGLALIKQRGRLQLRVMICKLGKKPSAIPSHLPPSNHFQRSVATRTNVKRTGVGQNPVNTQKNLQTTVQ